MAEQVTKLLPVCVACSRRMTFVDAIGSPEGPIAIFRCPDCKKLLWESRVETRSRAAQRVVEAR